MFFRSAALGTTRTMTHRSLRTDKDRTRNQSSCSNSILGFAVTVGPVFLLNLNKIDKNVLVSESEGRVQTVRNGFLERLFLFRVPPFVPGDLDHHKVVSAMDTDIIGIKNKIVGVGPRNGLL
jgi:hypothetical protein